MKKKRLGIVSSFNELCGNASYTRALKKSLEEHFDVDVLSLDVPLLRSDHRDIAQAHVKDITSRLDKFDCINIQFEAGLFGKSIASMSKNFFQIAKKSPNLVLTLHRLDLQNPLLNLKKIIKLALKFNFLKIIKEISKNYNQNKIARFTYEVINFCKDKSIPIIVHTQREKKYLIQKYKCNFVFDHPLSFYDKNYIEIQTKDIKKTDFYDSLKLNPDSVVLGLFGFINEYKSHETAIRSLVYLPKNYVLLICGSQHPHSINYMEPVNKYISDLLKLIEILSLENRVIFLRTPSDEEFLKLLHSCDFNIMPYYEVNQSGSAIASIALETFSKSIFSQNSSFLELEKYAPNAFQMISIGNFMELASSIKNFNYEKYLSGLNKYNSTYNSSTNAKLYSDLLNRNSAILECTENLITS